MFKMIAYRREDGEKHTEQIAPAAEYFDRYKGKSAYFIEIYEKTGNRYRLIYSEK